MSELALFQEAFAEALAAANPCGRMASAPGFAVYRNTSALGAVEALRAGYPTVDALLGADCFTAVALDFRAQRPPRSPVLAEYGAGFPAFLGRQGWAAELPYLPDVAQLDRLWVESHLAAEAAPSAEPHDRWRLHPATRFAWLETPALTIWLAHRSPGGFDSLEPRWRSEGALFTRRAGAVVAEPIDRPRHRLLVALAGGATLDAAAKAIGPTAELSLLLGQLVAGGALIPC